MTRGDFDKNPSCSGRNGQSENPGQASPPEAQGTVAQSSRSARDRGAASKFAPAPSCGRLTDRIEEQKAPEVQEVAE